MSKAEKIRAFFNYDYEEGNAEAFQACADKLDIGLGAAYVKKVFYQARKKEREMGGESAPNKIPNKIPDKIPDKQTWDERQDSASWEYKGYKSLRTLEEALQFCEVDLEVWQVERHIFNSWDVTLKGPDGKPLTATNYQVKIWFKPKEDFRTLEDIFAEFVETSKGMSPVALAPKTTPTDCMLEVDIFDPHFGKFAHPAETGDEYNFKIAKERFEHSINTLLGRTDLHKVSQIVFPVGNDWFHTDNFHNQTTKGTPQDVSERWWEQWVNGCSIAIETISMLSQIAPVKVPVVLSNHDWQNVFKMGWWLSEFFGNNRNVEVDWQPNPRKYFKWGKVGIGLTHGNQERMADLPNIMLQSTRKIWRDVNYMEWHIGHHHREKRIDYKTVDEIQGIKVRVMRSLSSTDAWHHINGYVHNMKGADAFVYHKKEGLINMVSVNM